MSKLQDLADAIGKDDQTAGETKIVEHTEYMAGVEEVHTVTITRAGRTLGHLVESGNGRWKFDAPDDARYADVAPIIGVLDAENVKLSPTSER